MTFHRVCSEQGSLRQWTGQLQFEGLDGRQRPALRRVVKSDLLQLGQCAGGARN
jgi:hypothetical protein